MTSDMLNDTVITSNDQDVKMLQDEKLQQLDNRDNQDNVISGINLVQLLVT